ncbi:MAG: DegT/DnrJ/EryC1/StrS family aminotransferase [Candidatus Hydrogenedentes bacterium]|nr:DegT/DnrJ/EryC1/StrS family aminotransferase [Candidatus Hydrogenedentota bacterium]
MSCKSDININPHFKKNVQELVQTHRFDAPVYVTRPHIPTLETYAKALSPAWERQWLTNDGILHTELELALAARFDVPSLRLFCNGTVALLTALLALDLEDGEVITTPFTFAATVNTLYWRRLRPVFCDIDPYSCNLDPAGIEAKITSKTRAILPVHVYGRPCDVESIQAIADRHGLPVLYDAAHAFDVEYKGRSLLHYGTLSMLSFHATKLFNTAEGGALASPNAQLHDPLKKLKNFGIEGEDTIIAPGINGKMSELHAALGLTQLENVGEEIEGRRRIAIYYNERLAAVSGLALPKFDSDTIKSNYAYYPLRVDGEAYGMNRNLLQLHLQEFNVHARRYFHPLCSTSSWCLVEPGRLPIAEKAAQEMLCLPLYGTLSLESAAVICDIIMQLGAIAHKTL